MSEPPREQDTPTPDADAGEATGGPGSQDAGATGMPAPKPGHHQGLGSIRESLLRQHSAGADRENAARAAASATVGAQRRKYRGRLVAGRSVVAVVSALLLVYVGFQWNLVERTNKALDNSSGHGAYLHPTDPNISPPSAVRATGTTPGRSAPATAVPAAPATAVPAAVHYQPENILLLGSDTRAGANGNAGNDNGQQSTAQSDTVMVAHISADRQHVTILSIPRDLKINAPTCKEVNQTTGALTDQTYPVTPDTKWHFTNAFSVGGPACTDTAVQQLTGLQITRILGIDFQGFKTMVDALHGVTVNVCRPIRDKTLGLVVAVGGVQRIGGDQALSLVRAREVAGDPSGDIGRIHRQQIVLS
ncbi:MAG: LCP family protein, partial [Nakamurella sp.]